MRKSFAFFICMVLTLIFAAVVLAQTNPTDQGAQGKPKMVIKKRALGTVVSVDVGAGTIAIKSKDVKMTFEVGPKTKVKVNGKAAGLENIPSGVKATIVYRRERMKRIALFIVVDTKSGTPSK